MLLRLIRLSAVLMASALLAVGCGGGGGPAEPPKEGLAVTSTLQSSAVVTWNMASGVEYWLFYGPTASAPTGTTSAEKWIGIPGGATFIKAVSPVTVSGLTNGVQYSFTINARTNGGPGGPVAAPVTVTPQAAGTRWTAATPNPLGTQDLRAMTVGTAVVAVGAKGAMFASADTLTWGPINPVTTNNLNGVNWTSTTNYFAVGNQGTILQSSDAISWTPQNSGTTQNLNSVTSSGTLIVAVGDNGTIITSATGATWTAATTVPTTAKLNKVMFMAGAFFAVGNGGTLLYSADGQTWTARTSGTTADLYTLTYGISTGTTTTVVYIVAGANGSLLTSPDGTTFTAQTLPVDAIYDIGYGLQYTAVGAGGKIFSSIDGLSWTIQTSPTTSNLYATSYGLNTFMAVGAGGVNLYSH